MKKCDEKQLTLWVAGELNPDEEKACRAHLTDCARCREHHAALLKIFNAFETHASALSPVDGAKELHAALQQKLRADKRSSYAASYSSYFRTWIMRLALPAAAMIVLVFWLGREKSSPVSSQTQIVQTQSSPAKTPDRPPDPTFSNYSSASRRSLEDFDRLLDAQLRGPASTRSSSPDTSVTLQTML